MVLMSRFSILGKFVDVVSVVVCCGFWGFGVLGFVRVC